MVSALCLFRATSRDTTSKLNGRFYSATAVHPVYKPIHTQTNRSGRAPRLDLLLAGNRLQPHIHNAIVTVVYRGTKTRFHVFVKNHRHLRPNRIVQGWNNGAIWRGDVVVMRKGLVNDVVNMRGGDASLADFVVKRFVERVRQKPRFHIPKGMVFYKP